MNNFFNRELSWLEFNDSVLEEAKKQRYPLLERIKFLSIVSSNLDEFFMIRVAGLYDQVAVGFNKLDIAGLTPIEQIDKISKRVQKMLKKQYDLYNLELIPSLFNKNIQILTMDKLNQEQELFLERYYWNYVYPILTPMVVDKNRTFPLIANKSLNIALLLENQGRETKKIEIKEQKEQLFATIQVPAVLKRFIEVPEKNKNKKSFVLFEDLIKQYISTIFKGHKILSMSLYRITRNADLSVDEEGSEDLLEAIEESLKRRKWGNIVRLEVEENIDELLLEILVDKTEVYQEGIYKIKGPIDLSFLINLYNYLGRDDLKFSEIEPQKSIELENKDIFEVVSNKDVLLHHPYQSFEYIINLVKKAALDPDVLAIKQTLYRVGGDSPIVEALTEAAERGKQVTVLLELKARFDEKNNIQWAKRLEKAGCHVIYGLNGLKTHSKVLLIIRKELDGIKRYVHISTGNYNDITAKLYTDLAILTSNPHIGTDISSFFNMITGYSDVKNLYKIDIAPISLRKKFISLIRNEASNAREGKKAHIIAKMNALVDKEIIEELYKASQAGVEIKLIVRGICCLRPGIKKLSENIKVISIIGRFLEHNRIYNFYNNGKQLYFISSADWMTRNLDRRVEILLPIEAEYIKQKIKEILEIFLKDTLNVRILQSDGSYKSLNAVKNGFSSQEYFYKIAMEAINSHDNIEKKLNQLI